MKGPPTELVLEIQSLYPYPVAYVYSSQTKLLARRLLPAGCPTEAVEYFCMFLRRVCERDKSGLTCHCLPQDTSHSRLSSACPEVDLIPRILWFEAMSRGGTYDITRTTIAGTQQSSDLRSTDGIPVDQHPLGA